MRMNNLVVSSLGYIDDCSFILGVLVLVSGAFSHEGPDFVKIDDWLVKRVSLEMEVSHTELEIMEM
jgi:hypothetical protein